MRSETQAGWDTESHSFPHFFRKSVEKNPDRIAVISTNGQITYAELDVLSDYLASDLLARGLQSEQMVCVATPRNHEYLIGFLAVCKAGGCVVPIDSALPEKRIEMIKQDAKSEWMIKGSNLREEGQNKTLFVPDLEEVSDWDRSTIIDFPEVAAEQLIYTMFTSGSTGRPKGVMIEHRSVVNFCYAIQSDLGISAADCFLAAASVGFDIATFELLTSLFFGCSIYFAEKDQSIDGKALADICSSHHVTMLMATSGTLQMMLEAGWQGSAALTIIFIGEPMPPKLAKDLCCLPQQPRLCNYYGPTEATVAVTGHIVNDLDRAHLIGWEMAGCRLLIVDEEGQCVERGKVGQLVIGGVCLARGYLGRPDLNKEKFRMFKGFGRGYLSGDLARQDPEDGILECLGRIDSQIKIRGYRVELGEIEKVIVEHENVRQVVVKKWTEESRGIEFLAAYVVTEHPVGNIDCWEADVRQHAADSLAVYMVPDTWVVLDDFPKNANGKVDRNALPKPDRSAFVDTNSKNLPTNQLETQIAGFWGEVLGLETVPRDVKFFDLGGKSVQLARLLNRLSTISDKELKVADLFEHTTVAEQASLLKSEAKPARNFRAQRSAITDETIAVIGYAGRFPGADSVEDLWQMVCEGREGIRDLSDQELLEKGVPAWMVDHPDYIKRGADILGADSLDADLFGMGYHEAEVTDPQGRVFLETCHDALFHAGCVAEVYRGKIGVFGGSGIRSYSWNPVRYGNLGVDDITEMVGNEKDYLTSRVSYYMDLSGPSVPVQTACSSSLAAIHLARQSLLFGDSDVALAGGVSLSSPQGVGYMAAEGTMFSTEGRCSTFSNQADGTIFSHGSAVVVLKRLSDAQRDGDVIHGVLLGTGISNDGKQKIGFSAPSSKGQAEAIRDALGDIDPNQIQYIEAHGTGTMLGDPIELRGLVDAYQQRDTDEKCIIGSVKSNIGHMDAAAGVTGFIKALLVAKEKQVPPSLHVDSPTDEFDFENSIFRINHSLEPLPSHQEALVGVSAFGMGGTNVHAIIGPPPPDLVKEAKSTLRSPQMIHLSAASVDSLGQACAQIKQWADETQPSYVDLCYSLRHYRPDLKWRAAAWLEPAEKDSYRLQYHDSFSRVVEYTGTVFLFTGQGSQYFRMAEHLYRSETVFKDTFDQIAEIADPILDCSLVAAVYEDEANSNQLTETWLTQPALFAIEYSMAQLWQSKGVKPDVVIGHSVGEFVAACVAGIFTLEQAVIATVERARLMWRQPKGKMAAVRKSSDDINDILDRYPELTLASENSNHLCVLAGPERFIDELIGYGETQDLSVRKLHTSHAFHSTMIEAAVDPFRDILISLGPLSPPNIPLLANSTGTWITPEEAVSVDFWSKQMLKPVLFKKGIQTAIKRGLRHFIEVGPGNTLITFTNQSLTNEGGEICSVQSLPNANSFQTTNETQPFAMSLSQYWAGGGSLIDSELIGRKIELPRYCYDRKRFWRDDLAGGFEQSQAKRSLSSNNQNGVFSNNEVKELVSKLAGVSPEVLSETRSFLELGFDSILLTQLSSAIEKRFDIKVNAGELTSDISSVALLTERIEAGLPTQSKAMVETVDLGFQNRLLEQLTTMQHQLTDLQQQMADLNGRSNKGHQPAVVATTESQKELFLASLLEPTAACTCNESVSLHLTGRLDKSALERAVASLVDRHDCLRATFSEDGMRMQIHPNQRCEIACLVAKSEDELQAILFDDASTPYDLIEGPLFRCKIIQLAEEENVLLISGHHLVVDGWSFNVIGGELAQLYQSYAKGASAEMPLAPSFTEYSRFVEQFLDSADHSQQKKFWLNKFKDAPVAADLPTDRNYPSERSYRGGNFKCAIDAKTTEMIRMLGSKHGCTLYNTVFACFQLLLHRLSCASDLVVCVPFAGQTSKNQWQQLVGNCVNFLPLRSVYQKEMPFIEFLHQCRAEIHGAGQNRLYSYGELISDLGLDRDSRRMVLQDAVFNLERMGGSADWGNLKVEMSPNAKSHLHYSFYVNITESSNGLSIDASYNRDILDEQTVALWMTYFKSLIGSIVQDPEQTISSLKMMSEDQQNQVLEAWNRLDSTDSGQSLQSLFSEVVTRHPNYIALVCESREVSYLELEQMAENLAGCLQQNGCLVGSRIAIMGGRSIDMVVSILAVLKAGGVYVPIDPTYPEDRIAYLLENSQASVLLVEEAIDSGFAENGVKTILISEALADRFEYTAVDNKAEDAAYIMYTSGSTGAPKGTVIPHRGVARLVLGADYIDFGPEHTYLLSAPITFDASTLEIWGPLLHGGKLAMLPAGTIPSLSQIARALDVHKVTTLWLTSGLFSLMVDEHLEAITSVRQVLTGGDVISPKHVGVFLDNAQPECRLYNGYGPTESTTFTTVHSISKQDLLKRSIPIGRPINQTSCYLFDSEMNPVPVGVKGRLYIGGNGLALGYLNMPELTNEKFIKNPFYTGKGDDRLYDSGDECRWLSDGTIEFLGRVDQQIKIRGFRIEPGEIELAIAEHPAVNQAVVQAVGENSANKHLVAWIKVESEITAQAIREYVTPKLPSYLLPQYFHVVDEFPVTANGKVDYRSLVNSHTEEPVVSIPLEATSDAFSTDERRLADIWSEVLNCEIASPDANFFNLGGNSLAGLRLFTRIQKTFGKELPLATLFQAPTIRQLANRLIDGNCGKSELTNSVDSVQIVSQLRSGDGPSTLVLIHGGDGGSLFYKTFVDGIDSFDSIYTIEAPCFVNRSVEPPMETIEVLASIYIEKIAEEVPLEKISIGGYSFGGLVALEMAQQLLVRGEKTDRVYLFDSSNPRADTDFKNNYFDRLKSIWQSFDDTGITSQIGKTAQAVLSAFYNKIQHWRLMKAVDSGSEMDLLTRKAYINNCHVKLMSKYQPAFYSGEVTLFRANSTRYSYDREMGWKALLPNIEVYDVEGGHLTMFDDQYVDSLVDAFSRSVSQRNDSHHGRSKRTVRNKRSEGSKTI